MAPWPDEAMEAAMGPEVAERDQKVRQPTRREREKAETLDGGPLPELDTLIAQIPADQREAMEELFRAKWQSVRRVPSASLKDPADK